MQIAPVDVVLALSAIGVGILGIWRCKTADRNLRHQQYLSGCELLFSEDEDLSKRYKDHIVGVITLAKLMEKDPKEYDAKVVAMFQRFLSSIKVFGADIEGHKKGEIDYESTDTVEAINALNKRPNRYKKVNPPKLWPSGGPLIVKNGTITPNTSHDHFKRWVQVKGRPPNYRD